MSEFAGSIFLVGILVMIFYAPYLLAKGIVSLDHEPELVEKLTCAIPIYNVVKAENLYFGKLYFATYSTIAVIFTTVFRIIVWRLLYNNAALSMISIILFMVGLIAYYFANGFLAFTIMKDSNVVSMGIMIISILFFPFGYFYIGNYLVNVIRHSNSKEDFLEGD